MLWLLWLSLEWKCHSLLHDCSPMRTIPPSLTSTSIFLFWQWLICVLPCVWTSVHLSYCQIRNRCRQKRWWRWRYNMHWGATVSCCPSFFNFFGLYARLRCSHASVTIQYDRQLNILGLSANVNVEYINNEKKTMVDIRT